MQQIFRDPERQGAIERQGFAVVPLFDEAEAAALLDRLERLEREAPEAPMRPDEALRKSFFHPDPDYRTRVDSLGREALAGPLSAILEGYRIVACGQFTKRPNAKEMGIHRDWTMMRDPALPAFNIWCPLVPVDRRNGTLALLPGSHKLPNVETPGIRPFYEDYPEPLKKRSVSFALRPGEAVIFDNRLLHWSTANRTAEPRPVLRAVTVPEGERIVFYRLDEESGGSRFEILDIEEEGALAQTPRETEEGRLPRRSLGFVANDNRSLSLRECEALLGAGPRAAGPVAALVRRFAALVAG
jgi:Phytanoyl-CoA dioxygenase (PhyH)